MNLHLPEAHLKNTQTSLAIWLTVAGVPRAIKNKRTFYGEQQKQVSKQDTT